MNSANTTEIFWAWSYSKRHNPMSIAVLKLSETRGEVEESKEKVRMACFEKLNSDR